MYISNNSQPLVSPPSPFKIVPSVMQNQTARLDPSKFSIAASPTTTPKQSTNILGTMMYPFIQLPLQLAQGASVLYRNISDFSESAKAQRLQDQKQGTSVLAGAKNFSSDVIGFYQFLNNVDLSKLNRTDIVPHLGGLAQNYLQKESGAQIFSSLQQMFPETMQEMGSIFGGGTSGAVTNDAAAQATQLGNQVIAPGVGTLGSIGGKVLGWAGAAYSLYEIFKGKLDPASGALSGAAAGAYIGTSILPGIGTVVGGLIGGVGGFLSGMFKSGKPQEQKERDAVRKQLKEAGILDDEWKISLANGAMFDMGKDGGAKLISKDGSERKYKEFDSTNPLTQAVAQVAAPLAQSMSAGNARLAQEFTAYFTNAATSNTDSVEGALQNLQVIYAKFGVPIERVLQGLAQQRQQAGSSIYMRKAA